MSERVYEERSKRMRRYRRAQEAETERKEGEPGEKDETSGGEASIRTLAVTKFAHNNPSRVQTLSNLTP